MTPHDADSISTSSQEVTAVPDGFVLITFEDGSHCIVPEFLVPATNDAFNGYRKRLAMDITWKSGGVSVYLIGAGNMRWPRPGSIT